jgi:hypothetical protein
MRGGHNRKSTQQHIIDGTYRFDRHGYISETNMERLNEMKQDLYDSIIQIIKEMKKLDKLSISYKRFNKIINRDIKLFHKLCITTRDKTRIDLL